MFQLIAKAQDVIQGDLEANIRDTSNARWTDAEIYRAMNRALATWGSKVRTPHIYTLTDGFESDEREYALPEYVVEPIDVQFQYTNDDRWHDFETYDVHATSSGGKVLRLGYFPPDVAARVIYWPPTNGAFPTTIPTITTSSITSSSTSVILNAALPLIPQSGYVKAEAEWMSYHGVTFGASTTTLLNLERGLFGTTAASHNTAVSVYWGVVVHDAGLFEQLQAQAMAFLYGLYMTNASSHEMEQHQFSVRWWQQQADMFWRSYVPMRHPRVRLNRKGLNLTGSAREYQYFTNDTGNWWQ